MSQKKDDKKEGDDNVQDAEIVDDKK